MDSINYDYKHFLQYENLKRLFIPSAKGQTTRTNTAISAISANTTTGPTKSSIQPDKIVLQDSNLLQLHLATPTSEVPSFQQVPIFVYDSIDNNIDEEAYVEQNNEQLIVQDNSNLAIVPVNVSNTLTDHQLQVETQSQFIISLSPEIAQLLDSNISQQLSISVLLFLYSVLLL